MNEPDANQPEKTFGLLRKLSDQMLDANDISLEQAKELVNAAILRRERRLLPPENLNLTENVAKLTRIWKQEWTDEIRISEEWAVRDERMKLIRQLLMQEKLAEAAEELEELLAECSAGVRAVVYSDSIRQMTRQDEIADKNVLQQELARFVRWLQSI